MAPRRRALRDHGDAAPLVALARAAVQEACEAIERAREGLEQHYRSSADCRILDSGQQRAEAASDYD